MKDKVDGANFIRALADGSINADDIDQEAIFVRYLDSSPSGLDQVKVSTSFVSIEDKMYRAMREGNLFSCQTAILSMDKAKEKVL